MTIKIGTAPDSWGVWFPEDEKQISWQHTMDEMADAGYEYIELGPWGYFPTDYKILKNELKKRELTLIAGTVGGNFIDDDSISNMLNTIDDLVELLNKFPKAEYVVILVDMYTDLMTGEQIMPKKLRKEQWNKLYDNVQKVSDYIRNKSLTPTLHPHVDCYIETEEEIENIEI